MKGGKSSTGTITYGGKEGKTKSNITETTLGLTVKFVTMAQVRATYTKCPNSYRNVEGGWVHWVIRHDKTTETNEQWETRVYHAVRGWANKMQMLTRKNGEIIASFHADPRFHAHIAHWHYRGCQTSASLWRLIQDCEFGTASWQPSGCKSCLFFYVGVGRGDKRVFFPETDVERSRYPGLLPPGRCEAHGANADGRSAEIQDQCIEDPIDPGTSQGASQDTGGVLWGLPTAARSQQGKTLVRLTWIRQIIKDTAAMDFNQFSQVIVNMGDEDLLDQHSLMMATKSPNYIELVEAQINIVKQMYRLNTWQELAREVTEKFKTIDWGLTGGFFMELQQSWDFVMYWCYINDLNPLTMVTDLEQIINRRKTKYNMWYLKGDSNAFKSKMCTSILRSCIWGSTITGVDKDSIRFKWQNSVNDRVVYWDECKQSDAIAETTKSIMGGENVLVDVKYMQPQRLARLPVLCSSNDWMWNGCTTGVRDSFRQAIRARGQILVCKPVPGGDQIHGEIDPRVWQILLQQANLMAGDLWSESLLSGEWWIRVSERTGIPINDDRLAAFRRECNKSGFRIKDEVKHGRDLEALRQNAIRQRDTYDRDSAERQGCNGTIRQYEIEMYNLGFSYDTDYDDDEEMPSQMSPDVFNFLNKI